MDRGLKILVVEDDHVMSRTLMRLLERLGHQARLVETIARAHALAIETCPEVVILDIGLPDGSGLDHIEVLRRSAGNPTIVVLTGRCDLQATVTAIHRGAATCLTKPFAPDELGQLLESIRTQRIERPHRMIPALSERLSATEMLVASSPKMRRAFVDVARVSKNAATVLITGETGVGKEVIARAIYEASACDGPFVALNCAALSPSLFEAELFGHRRGAFTGADRASVGRIEAAAGGVLFLDEIGELPLELQAKLLRVLQERTYERVGETEARPVEARIVAATNRNLPEEVAEGRFREDLLYRLLVAHIEIPALKDRGADLPVLVQGILGELARQTQLRAIAIDAEAEQILMQQSWPGNVRQLANLLGRIVMAGNDHVTAALVRSALEADPTAPRVRQSRQLAEMERRHIAQVLEESSWVKRRAAEALGISRSRLDRKMVEYGLGPSEERC